MRLRLLGTLLLLSPPLACHWSLRFSLKEASSEPAIAGVSVAMSLYCPGPMVAVSVTVLVGLTEHLDRIVLLVVFSLGDPEKAATSNLSISNFCLRPPCLSLDEAVTNFYSEIPWLTTYACDVLLQRLRINSATGYNPFSVIYHVHAISE